MIDRVFGKFSSLPNELKISTLSHIDFNSNLKLLQTTKNLRLRVLTLGPFPRKIWAINYDLKHEKYCIITLFSPDPIEFRIEPLGLIFQVRFPFGYWKNTADPLHLIHRFVNETGKIRLATHFYFTRYSIFSTIFPKGTTLPYTENLEIRISPQILEILLENVYSELPKNCYNFKFEKLIDEDSNSKRIVKKYWNHPGFKNMRKVCKLWPSVREDASFEIPSLIVRFEKSENEFFKSIDRAFKVGMCLPESSMIVLATKFEVHHWFHESRIAAYAEVEQNFAEYMYRFIEVKEFDEKSDEELLLEEFKNLPISVTDLSESFGERFERLDSIFKTQYQTCRFYKTVFGRKAQILTLIEKDRYERLCGKYNRNDGQCRLRFVMKIF